MRMWTAFTPIPLVFALFVSQQELPWCFRFHGDATARCNYYSLRECLIGTAVIGGKCERYHTASDQLTPGQQQLQSAPKAKKTRPR